MQMSPPWYPHHRPSSDSYCPLGQNQESLPLYQGPQIRYLKRSHFLFSFFTLPCLMPTLWLTHSPPDNKSKIHSLVWLSLLNLEFLLLGQTPSKINITLSSPVKPLKFYLLQEAFFGLIGRELMLFPTSVYPTSSPEQQQLHNNLVKGWGPSSQSKICRMDMGEIFFKKQTK